MFQPPAAHFNHGFLINTRNIITGDNKKSKDKKQQQLSFKTVYLADNSANRKILRYLPYAEHMNTKISIMIVGITHPAQYKYIYN